MAVTRTLTDRTFSSPSGTTHTFSGRSIGAAADDRLVGVVLRHLQDTGAGASGVTVGGVSATRASITSRATDSTLYVVAEIWLAVVPSGTTADIQISGVTANQYVSVAIYRVVGADTSDPVADADDGTGASNSASITLDVPAGGALVAGCLTGVATSGGFSIAWTGASEDEDESDDIGGFIMCSSAASRETGAQLLSESVSVVRSGTPALNVGVVLVGVAIRPAAEDAGFSDIFYGEDQINAIKSGSNDVTAVYYGTTKIFEAP